MKYNLEEGQSIPRELEEGLMNIFKTRMSNLGIKEKSQKYKTSQQEFIAGMVAAIDTMVGNEKASAITPNLFLTLIRGDIYKPVSEQQSINS